MSLDDLRNMKHASLSDWIVQEAPRRTIKREFKDFLLTYVDEHGTSVYGERIKDMGESKFFLRKEMYGIFQILTKWFRQS